MTASHYTPISEDLPAVMLVDQASARQIESFLSLLDDPNRALIDALEDLETWLSPDGPLERWPIDVPLDAGRATHLAAVERLYSELASWFAFMFPASWRSTPTAIEKQRSFLLRAARLWRRRGTPRGYLDWLCFAFDISEEHRPFLLEHFKFGQPESSSSGDLGPEPGLRATMLVPTTSRFEGIANRRHFIEFATRYAPAHIHLRVCWVRQGFTLDPVPGPRPTDTADLAVWESNVVEFRERIRDLLCSLVSFIDHASGVRIYECIDEGGAADRLGVARLPGGGEPEID